MLARVVAVDEEIISWLKRRERRQRQEVREEADPNKPRSFVAPEGIRGDRGRLPTASSITPCHLNIQASCSGFCTTDKSRLGQLYPDQADALAIGVMVDDQRDGALPRRAVELHDVGSGDGDVCVDLDRDVVGEIKEKLAKLLNRLNWADADTASLTTRRARAGADIGA